MTKQTKIDIKPPIMIEDKNYQQKIILDPRAFNPCQGKEVEQWSWKKMRNEKIIVHVSLQGIIDIYKI